MVALPNDRPGSGQASRLLGFVDFVENLKIIKKNTRNASHLLSKDIASTYIHIYKYECSMYVYILMR